MLDPAAAWNNALQALRTAEVEEKGKALESLQQLADQMAINLGGEARVKVVFNTLSGLQELLLNTPPKLEADQPAGSELRAAAFHLISKLNFTSLVQTSSASYIKLSGIAFDTCYSAITSDNEENGRLCCKTMGMIIKGRRQVLQHYPNSGVEYNTQVQTLVNLLIKQLGGLDALWQAKVATAAQVRPGEGNKQEAPPVRASASLKVLVELCQTVNMSLSYTSTEVATEYGRSLWPLLLSGIAVSYDERPPPDVPAQAYSQICEDIASVQTRILQLIGVLSPAKLEASTADSTKLVDNIIRMLHTAPVSANTNREMLVSARQILAAGLKAPPEDQFNIHVRSRILDVLKDGALFSRQRVDTHQYIARQVVIDITLLARKQLSISQLDNILDVFTSDLQNEHLPLTIQIRVSELVMRLLEHLTAFLRVQRTADSSTVKPLFCKCLIALLAKIDSLAHHSAHLVERMNSDSGGEPEARTIGIKWPWVPHIDTIGSSVMPTRTDVTKETEHTRQTIIRCLQSLVHTFSGLNMLTSTDTKAPVLMPVELRLVAEGLSSALRAIRTIQQGLPQAQAHTMYDSIPHILMYLNYSVFTDLMFSHFDILFEAVLEDEQLWSIFPMMLKSSREPVRPQLVQKQLIIVQAILQYVANNELENLAQPGKRASVAIKLAEVALRRLPDPSFKEAQFLPLIPVYKQLLTSCMKLIQVSDNTDNYLALLLMACKAVSQKADVQHHQLIAHVVDTGVVADLLRLLFSMLEGPVVNCSQRDQIAALLLQMPCHLSDLIKQDSLTNLTKPLLLAFQSSDQDIVSLAFQVMELWTDSLTPQFLDAKMTNVMPGMLEALSGYVNKNPFGQRALTLLGKFGGRSHAHINGPQPIEYNHSLDKGLRPVFVFKPSTSCLVPLDVCINLLLEGKWQPSEPDNHYREQAFNFIASCLNRVLNMDSQVSDSNTPLDEQLASLLAEPNVKLPQNPSWSCAAKTTQQYIAEEKAVEDMVVGMIMFSSHTEVATEAKRYVSALTVHLAMLFVIGKAQSEQELGVIGCWSATQPVNNVKSSYGALYMNMLVPVRAFARALQRDDSLEIKAACTALAELVVAVLTLAEARKVNTEVKAEPEKEAGAEENPATSEQKASSPTMKTESPADGPAPDDAAPASMGPPPAQKQKSPPDTFAKLKAQLPATSPSSQTGLPPVLDDITASVLRASCGDDWSCRIGGTMGLGVLVKALPTEYLKPWAPQFCAAFCRVFRVLPDHATAEIAALSKILRELCLKTIGSAPTVKSNDENAMDVDDAPDKETLLKLDYDIMGVLDQLSLALFSAYSSQVARGAALESLHAVAEALRVKPSDLVGERISEPHIALSSLTFFYRTSSGLRKQTNTQRIILLRNSLTTAQVLSTFVRIQPTLMENSEMFSSNVSEALRLLNSTDDVILRMLIPARDSMLSMNPCATLKIACMEFLSALMQQPTWCQAEENKQNIGQIVELLTMHLLHPNEKLADLSYDTLKNTACNLETEECTAKIMCALEGTMSQVGVPTGSSSESKLCTNKKQIQQRLNNISFIQGLHRTLSLFSTMVPDALGLTLVQHLSGWVNPSEMLRPAPADATEGSEQPGGSLPADFAPGDELRVPAALLDLFHLLPPQSKDLLQTSNNRHGLIILTIELEQVLEKHVHAETAGMSNIKLWSHLRAPLLRFLCKHLSETAHYFFNMEDCRLFQPDYFWMLHDLTLHELGAVLLDAICSSGSLWIAVLDRVLHDVSEPGAPFTSQAFRVLHLMAAITAKRPMWLTEQAELWPKILALWEHPNRATRLGTGFRLGSHERSESHMLAKLILSYIDKNKEELPRICDLFTLFAHPVANTLFLTKYCSEDLMQTFSVQQRSELVKYFMSELLTEKWPAQVMTETMCYVIIPTLKDAEKKQEMQELLPEELLDLVFDTICKQQRPQAISQYLSCEQVKCMCETQKALQIVMQAVPAVRWQKHCKAMISLCWYVMRVRREEILMDVTLLTAAKYFKHIVPLQLTHNSMRDRLARHYLQIFVTLLRTSASEHDQMLVFDAVDAMMPYMEVYAGPSASSVNQEGTGRVSQPAPIWLNYVRKCMMDYTESPGISSHNTFMSIAHVWRIVICYADHFYPHITHLNTQFIQCMPRLISNAAHGMDHWPVVLDMGLCIAYWIRNLLAGRPIEHTRVSQGAKRPRAAGEDEPERVARQRTADAADVGNAVPGAPAEAAMSAEAQAAGNAEAGGEEQDPAAPAGSQEQVEPGTAVAKERLASVKLTSGILETLLSTCVRVAIWTDRHGARPKSASGQGWRSGEQQHSAGMWSRSMHVLKALHELLPTTHIKLQAVVMKALKENNEPQAYQTSVISTLLHIATFAHNAPGLLEDILPILSDRLMLLFQSPDNAVTSDLCTLMRVLEQEKPGTAGTPEKAKFRGEVTHHMVQQLSSVAADTAEPTTLAQSASSKNGIVMRAVIVTSLHLLNTMLDCGSTTEQTVDLVRMLPPIYHLFSKFLKQLGTANNNLMSVLATELPLKPGSFLHTFNLLQSMMKHSIVLNTISFVNRASQRVVQSIDAILCVFLQVKVPSEIGPQFACHVVSLIDTMVQTSSGPILKEDTACTLLQHVLDTLRKTQIRSGTTPGWVSDIEQLMYSICHNEDGLYSQELSDKCFALERDYGVGIASSNIEMRNKFRDVYDRKMGLMLTMLDTDRSVLLGKSACQGIAVLDQSKTSAALVSDLSQRNDGVSASQLGTASLIDGRASGLETAASAMNTSVNMDSAPSMPVESEQPSTNANVQLSNSAKELISKYASFLRHACTGKVAQLATAMYECSIADERMARHLYACIFPILWASLEQEEQMSLARPIVQLLTRVSDRQYEDNLHDGSTQSDSAVAALKAVNHTKSVKVLMQSVQMCQPQPKLPAELTKCIAKNHCAWHIGVPLLESHVILFPEETRTFHALADLYRAVNEEDLALGLWKSKCYGTLADKGKDGKASHTDPASADHDYRLGNALTNLQLGHWDEAATALASLNRFYAEVYQQAHQSPQLQGTPPDHVLGKAQLIIEEWIGCMKQLNRWQDLHHVATNCGNPQLKVECEWRLGMWESLTTTIKSTQLSETPSNAMVTCYALAASGRQSELGAHLASAMARLQHEWSLLPPCDINAKIAMLQKANQWVEVSDGAKVVQEIKRCTMNSMQMASEQFSATSDTCETWRLRMPNVHDSLLHWATIVHWRNIIYDYMIQHFMNLEELNPSLYSLGFKDKSRSVNSLARVARKHGLPSLANHFINNMYRYPTMEVSEAFAKIQEQCKAYSEAKDQQAMGLTLINNTNLSYFPNDQKAAVFKLQGMLFEAMDDSEQAAQLYFTSLHIKEDAQSWLMWGKLCASKGERCGNDIIKARNLGEQSKNMTNQLMSKQHEYNENAVSCFFTALRLNASFGVFLVPHLLALLAHTSFIAACPMQQVVRDEMQHGPPPAHVLLPHIHYLVESLSRGEREIAKWLLRHVAQAFPQSAYSPLRVGVCHTREVVQRWLKEHEACSPSDQNVRKQEMKNLPETRAFEYARELFEGVRARQQIVSCNLERFFSEVAGRFNQRPEERLYNVVHTLLQRCYRLPLHKASTVPDDMKRELKNVCDACMTHELHVATRRRGMPAEMRERFVRDVQPQPTTTLQQLMASLKKWLGKLKEMCEAKFPPVVHLEEDFPVLAHMDFSEMELPGQFQQLEFSPESCVFVVRLGTRVSLIRRHGVSMRRIELICSDGITRFFTVSATQAHNLSSTDQRMMGVYRSVNWLLRKYPEARRRNLQLHAPIMVSMWPSARLIEESPSMMTYGETWEHYWARAGRESDKTIILFKDRVHQLMSQDQTKTQPECKLQAYIEITQKQGLASDQILSQFTFKSMPTTSHVFLFKKQFTAQLALTSLFSYLISNAAPAPNKLLYERSSGAVFLQDMAVVYPGQHEQRNRNREMPYRVTRNISHFVTPFGLEGWFLISQVLAAQSMTRTKQNIHWPLYLFCRDDVTAHNLRSRLKVRTKTAEELEASNSRLGLLITQLVNDSMSRLRELSGAHDAGAINKARNLLKLSQEPKNLCMQDALFLPWF